LESRADDASPSTARITKVVAWTAALLLCVIVWIAVYELLAEGLVTR
jgi:hypothetical protein